MLGGGGGSTGDSRAGPLIVSLPLCDTSQVMCTASRGSLRSCDEFSESDDRKGSKQMSRTDLNLVHQFTRFGSGSVGIGLGGGLDLLDVRLGDGVHLGEVLRISSNLL